MKFVYCGFDFFDSCLLDCISSGHELLCAFSHPVDGVYNSSKVIKSVCKQHSVPFHERALSKDDIAGLVAQGCDFVCAAAYVYRLPADELSRAGIRAFNIHPTLLPVGRGPWPLPYYLLKEMDLGGVTIHKVVREFDAGDILGSRKFEIIKSDNLETVSFKARKSAVVLLREILSDFDTRWNGGVPQEAGSYWPMPSERDRTLDFGLSIRELDNIVRAFGKFDSYATFDGRDWLIQDACGWHESHTFPPGTIVDRSAREVLIATRDGFLCLRQFKQEPKYGND